MCHGLYPGRTFVLVCAQEQCYYSITVLKVLECI